MQKIWKRFTMPLVFLLGTFFLVLGYFFVRWLKRANRAEIMTVIKIALVVFASIFLTILILTGQFYRALILGGVSLCVAVLARSRLRRKKSPNLKGYHKGSMTLEMACDILGVEEDASEIEIRRAHKEMLKRVHPDQGGSDYLCKQVNQARDFLLAALKKRSS